jgi:hypothetical protein
MPMCYCTLRWRLTANVRRWSVVATNTLLACTVNVFCIAVIPQQQQQQQQHNNTKQQSSKESRSLTFPQFIAALDRIAALMYPDVQTVAGAPVGLRAKQARLLTLTDNHLLLSTTAATTSSLSSSPTAAAAAAAAVKVVRSVRVRAERAAVQEVAAAAALLQGLARGAAGRRRAAAARAQRADQQVCVLLYSLV